MHKSTFLGLNTALRGMLAQQASLDVTGQNISNLSTKGYTRQRAELSTTQPWSSPSFMSQTTPGQLGTGVEVLRLERLRDKYIDDSLRGGLGRQASDQTTVDQLTQVETAFAEPGDNGISKLLSNYFTKASALSTATAADQPGARQAFAEAADALAAGFRQLDTDLTNIQQQSNTRLNDDVTTINSITTNIAALNAEIKKATDHGQQPNDLLDRRDLLMDKLSQLVNFTSTELPTGEVTITMGTTTPIALVDPAIAGGATAITRTDLDTGFSNGDITSGSVFADEQLWDPAGAAGSAGTGTIDTLRGRLDTLVNTIVTATNTQSAAGFDLNGNPGGNIFLAAGVTAATFGLDPANNIRTNPNLVAAASSWNGAGEPGNGANMAAIAYTMRAAAQAGLGGSTIEAFYSQTVTGLGAMAATASTNLANSDVLVDMGTARRDSVSGVSLDEEMTNMLKFQHAYNASARVLTTMDDAIDTIINRMGRVGL
ncbi:MAG: flagellar hook-associated protein FlgK [Thermoleophilia bacterium]|nr:flagellar hook-associated protein FlgK [Thermoleophilia bacterium]